MAIAFGVSKRYGMKTGPVDVEVDHSTLGVRTSSCESRVAVVSMQLAQAHPAVIEVVGSLSWTELPDRGTTPRVFEGVVQGPRDPEASGYLWD